MKLRKWTKALMAGAIALGMVGAGAAANAAPDLGPGNIDPSRNGSLTIVKCAGEPLAEQNTPGTPITDPSDCEPLEGVQFTVWQVQDLSVTDAADWAKISELNKFVVDNRGDSRDKDNNRVNGYTLVEQGAKTTGANGTIKWEDLPLGVYYVEETKSPSNVAMESAPFIVTIPLPKESDAAWIYDVIVYPKNTVQKLEKEVEDIGAAGLGKQEKWTITWQLPAPAEGQEAYSSLILTDKLDSRLSYVEGSTRVSVGTQELIYGEDYTLTWLPDEVTTAPEKGGKMKITFTASGLGKVDAGFVPGVEQQPIVWSYDTIVTSLSAGEEGEEAGIYENEAQVYPNDSDMTNDNPLTSNKVKTLWGPAQLYKYAQQNDPKATDKALAGAVFQIFGTYGEAQACSALVLEPDFDREEGCPGAITVTRDNQGNVIADPGQNKFTSDEEGNVKVSGLHISASPSETEVRDYWFVEIQQPAGYEIEPGPYQVSVRPGDNPAETGAVKNVPNSQESPSKLPQTGAQVTMVMIIGAILLGSGAVLLTLRNRKKSATVDA